MFFLALSSCSSSDEDYDENTPATISPIIPFDALQGHWLWTGVYDPIESVVCGTWEESYCEISENEILFYHHEINVDFNTGTSSSVRIYDERCPVTYTSPNILHFNNQDYRVTRTDDGYLVVSDTKGYVLKRF